MMGPLAGGPPDPGRDKGAGGRPRLAASRGQRSLFPLPLLPQVGIDHPVVVLGLPSDALCVLAQFQYLAPPHLALGRRFSRHELLHDGQLTAELIEGEEQVRRVHGPVLHLRQLLPRIVRQFAAFGEELLEERRKTM